MNREETISFNQQALANMKADSAVSNAINAAIFAALVIILTAVAVWIWKKILARTKNQTVDELNMT